MRYTAVSEHEHYTECTFENAYLSGDVSNQNAEILLHNWHKDEEI